MKISFLACVLIMSLCLDAVVAQSNTSTRLNAEERRKSRKKSKERDVDKLLSHFDKDKDQELDKTELPKALRDFLSSFDKDGDGKLSRIELLKMNGRPGTKVGEIITGPARGERYDDNLKIGDPAPDFKLSDSSGKRMVTLSSFRGKKPVVLIFGSYT
jgi:Ca2+-binding EF-hand superfamily protein